MGIFKKTKIEPFYTRPSEYSCFQAFKKGDMITKLSLFVFGLGNFMNKQIARGIIFIAIELGYLAYMITFGAGAMVDFVTLGTVTQGEVYNEALGIYEYSLGDNSMLCLLYGVITLVLTLAAVFVGFISCKSAFCTQYRKEKGMKKFGKRKNSQ